MPHISPQLVDPLIVAITGLAVNMAALAAALAAWLRSRTNTKKLDATAKNLETNTAMTSEIKEATNGKMDKVVDIVTAAAQAAKVAATIAQAHAVKVETTLATEGKNP